MSLGERSVELSIAAGERLLAPVERYVGRRSLVGDRPFFANSAFPWIEELEGQWQQIRDELQAVLAHRKALPNFQEISRDQQLITDDDRWKTLFIYGYGFKTELGSRLCPHTTALVEAVPGMVTAMFSILSPRKSIPPHRGPYKGLLRYHLGLIVPVDPKSCSIRVGHEQRHWQEGQSMIFDDTFEHEVFNQADELRAVLFLDVMRPLPAPYDAINRAIVKVIAHSPFIVDAKRNQRAWEERFLAGLPSDPRKAAAFK